MPRILVVLFALLLPALSFSQCSDSTIIVRLFDSFGDGWNGGSLDINDDLGANLSNHTLPLNALGTDTTCLAGGIYGVVCHAGGFASEQSWELELSGNIILSGGAPYNGYVIIGPDTGYAVGCTDPAAANYDPLATFDDGSCYYPPPPNDSCHAALPYLIGDTATGSTVTATNDNTGNMCGTPAGGSSVWYTIVGTGEEFRLSLGGSDFDTKINVYTGTCSNLICEGGNDDNVAELGTHGPSYFSFLSTLSTTYLIQVSGYGIATGNYVLTSTADTLPSVANNDSCHQALTVLCGDNIAGHTYGATVDSGATCMTNMFTGVWYRFVGTGEQVELDAWKSSTWTACLAVYTGTCDSLLCTGSPTELQDSGTTYTPTTFFGVAGVEYFIHVFGFGVAQAGTFGLSINCTGLLDAQASTVDFTVACGTLQSAANAGPVFTAVNSGDIALTSVTVLYYMDSLSGSAQTSSFNVNIAPGDSGQVTLNPVPILAGAHTLWVHITNVNGVADPDATNNLTTAGATWNAAPGTQLTSNDCGRTYTSFLEFFHADILPNATAYEFLLTDPLTSNTVVGTSTGGAIANPYIRLSDVNGLQPATIYEVKVRAVSNGCITDYGSVCTVTTPTLPTTQLSQPYINTTLSSLGQYFYCDQIPGATRYEYLLTEGGNVSVCFSPACNTNAPAYTFFSMLLTPSPKYSTTYAVQIRAKVAGVWGPYGTPYNITTPAEPTVSLLPADCGTTVTDLADNLYINSVSGAQRYQFEVTHSSGYLQYAFSHSGTPTSTLFRMSWAPSLQSATTYQVRARAKIGGVWGTYGPSCDVTTPPAALPQLQSTYCNITLTSLSTYVHTVPIYGAQRYAYEITDGAGFSTLAFSYWASPSSTWMALSTVPGIQPNTTYHIRVMAKINGVWNGYGPSCDITTPAASAKAEAEEDFAWQVPAPTADLMVFPNPASEYVNVFGEGIEGDQASVRCIDLAGRVLLQHSLPVVNGQVQERLTIPAHWPAGLYVLMIQHDGGRITRKLQVAGR